MINITDTEIRTMELEKLLDKIDTQADLKHTIKGLNVLIQNIDVL